MTVDWLARSSSSNPGCIVSGGPVPIQFNERLPCLKKKTQCYVYIYTCVFD